MRDGVVLRADVYRPAADGPWPVLLTRLPYGKNLPMLAAMMEPVGDLDAVADTTYWELPAGHHPAFERHGIPELGFERSRREPEWNASCRVAGRQAEVDLPSMNTGGWYDIFCQGTLDNFTAMR